MSAVNGTRIFRPGVPQVAIDQACNGDDHLVDLRSGRDPNLTYDLSGLLRADLWVGYASQTEVDRSQSQPQQIVSWVQLVTEGGTP